MLVEAHTSDIQIAYEYTRVHADDTSTYEYIWMTYEYIRVTYEWHTSAYEWHTSTYR